MRVRGILILVSALLVVGCVRQDEAKLSGTKVPETKPARKMKQVRIINGQYFADPGIKVLHERPPETLKQYIEKFGETPDTLFLTTDERFYRYVKGKLQGVETTMENIEAPR